jgi:hypothetical protein
MAPVAIVDPGTIHIHPDDPAIFPDLPFFKFKGFDVPSDLALTLAPVGFHIFRVSHDHERPRKQL